MAIGGSGKGIQIVVGADYNDKDLKRAQADLNRLKAQTDKSAGGLKAFGEEMKRSISTGSIIAAAAVTAFAVKSVKAFSEVEDAQSALSSTFGSTGDNLVTWANETAIAFNLSRREALQAAQTMAVFGDSAGLAGKDLEQFSVTLTERAADAASFFGGSTQEAITAFGAALRGENEPIRRYGVLLDDATLRAKALELGLVSTTKNALTPQQKTLAAYNVIMEQTTRVQGDVERTSDSMANQIKKAQAEFDNLQVAVGETIAVAIKPLLEALNGALGFFNGLPGPIKTTIVAVTAIGAAALILVPKILAVRTAFLQMQTAAVASGKTGSIAMMGLSKKALIAGVALSAAAAAAASSESDWVDLGGNLRDIENDAQRTANAMYGVISPGLLKSVSNFADGFMAAFIPTRTMLEEERAAVAAFDQQLAEMVGSGDGEKAAALFKQQADAAARYGASVDEVKALLPSYTAALESSAQAMEVAGSEASTAAPKIDILAGAQRRAKRAADGLAGALDGVESALARQAAMQGYREAMTDFVATPTTETAAAVIAAMTDAAESFDKPKKQAKFVDAAISDVKQVAQDADLQLKPYLEDSLTRAQRKAQDVKAAIDAIPTAKTVNIYYKQHSRQISDPTESASGGLVTGRAGAPRQDNLPFMLSRGEFVVQASAVKRFGAPFFEALNAGVRPLAEMGSAASAPTSSGLTINGGITVQSAPGERAETSLPRALRRAAFLAGVNG